MTNATLNLDWKTDTTYADNKSKLINFVKTELENNKEHKKFRLSYQDKDTKDIITEDTRLFMYNDGTEVAQFKKRAKRYGTALSLAKYFYKDKYKQYDLIKIEHLIPIQRKTESMKFHDNCKKILKHLSKYSIWTNYSLAIKTMDFLGLDLCKEIKRRGLNIRLYGLKLTEIEKTKYNIDCVNRLAQRLRLIAQTCDDNDVKANIMKHCNSIIDLSDIKVKSDYENEYIYPLKDMLYYGNIFSLVDCLYEIEHARVVKMRFTKRAGMFNDEYLERIKNSMENKIDCRFSSDNGYDVSFEYNAEKNRAWYSLEYRNCGNGHYYIALNDTHALHIEDD